MQIKITHILFYLSYMTILETKNKKVKEKKREKKKINTSLYIL